MEALDLIPLFARAAKDFDAAYEDDEGTGPEAAKNVGELLQFLWGMVNKKLNRISIKEASDDEEAKTHLLAMKARWILPPHTRGSETPNTPNEKSAFKQMTSTLSRVTEQLESANKLTILQIKQREEREDKKKDKTLDLHPSTIHMLKMAGSEDGETPLLNIVPSASRFFNCKTVGLADQELNAQFQALEIYDAGFTPGLTQSLWHGALLWHNDIVPRNLSPFTIFPLAPNDMEQGGRFLFLHIGEKSGKAKTLDEIRGATKQFIKAPTTYHEFTDSLRLYKGFLTIFIGKDNKVIENLEKLQQEVTKFSQAMKAAGVENPKFFAAFLYKIDLRVQTWLKECSMKMDREEVNDALVEFNTLVDQVRLSEFTAFLPSAFTLLEDGSSGDRNRGGNDGPANKRRKGNGQNGGGRDEGNKVVENKKPCAEFKMLEGETWDMFKGRKTAGNRPKWINDECVMCPRFHSRLYCFENCNNAASHVPEDQIPKELKEKYIKWLAQVRKDRK